MTNEASRSLSFCIPLMLVAAIALFSGPPAWSREQQTLHILVVADTADAIVGDGCVRDFRTVNRYFSETTNIPRNREISITYMTGDPPPKTAPGALKYSRDAILAHYKSLADKGEVKPTDTIFFYYSGHGGFVPGKGHCIFKFDDRKHALFRSELREAISQCKPRLAVIITDSCSNLVKIEFVMAKGLVEDRAQVVDSLFFKPSGIVDINSCSQGQESAGSDNEGGFFTAVFFDRLGLEVTAIKDQLERRGLPVKKDGMLTWREFFPLLMGPTAAKWKAAKQRGLIGGNQNSQDPQAYCLPNSLLDDPLPPFEPGLTVEASKKDGQDVLMVRKVEQGSPAEVAGLRVDDVIHSIDNKDIASPCELDCALNFGPNREKVKVAYERGTQKGEVSITKKKSDNQPQ